MSNPPRLSRRAQQAGGEPIASRLMAQALANADLVSLAAGFVDHRTLPVELVEEIFAKTWAEENSAREALQYGTSIGYAPLRAAVLERTCAADRRAGQGWHADVEQVVLTAGSNQLLYLVADVLLDPGDIVLCATPSYYVFLGTLANLGARAVGVATDEQGVIPEAVDEELRRLEQTGDLPRVKAIYVTTYYDNPTGITMPAARRAALVETARRWSRESPLYVIEDAAYRELRYYGPDLPTLRSFDPQGNTVIHAGTFSKSFSPGLRVGWGILPRALLPPLLTEKGNIDFGSPNFNQQLMARILASPRYDQHVAQLCARYREKLEVLLAAAEEFLSPLDGVHWLRPDGGLYLWLRLPQQVDTGMSGPLFPQAVREGVLYIPGEHCYPDPQRAPRNMLRLSFGSVPRDDLRRGAAALSRALQEVLPC